MIDTARRLPAMRALLLTAMSLTVAACLAPTAAAETFTVTKTADTNDGACDVDCSLREAWLAAQAGPPDAGDTVVLGPGTYDNTMSDFILSMDERITLTGAGARTTIVREVSGVDGRVFLVESGARLTLADVTLTGTQTAAAVLVLSDASLDAARVTLSGNSGPTGGGALANQGGAVAIADSALTGNSAISKGAGVFQNGIDPTLSMTNVTISGNSAPSGSGITVETGTATLRNVTLAGNIGSADLSSPPGAASIAGTIVGSCTGGAPTSLGFNLDAGSSCALAGQGDRSAADPLLAPLADNGGPTDTMALGAGSPAVDAGGACPPSAADQRGVARPQGGACDTGAFEAVPAPLAPVRAGLTRLRIRRVSRRAFLVSFTLDRHAAVRFRVLHARPGRRSRRRCVRPRMARPRARRCIRWVQVRSFSKGGASGANSFRTPARGLSRGRHRLVARPDGGAAVRRGFRVRPFRP